jgi:hypothetical protein
MELFKGEGASVFSDDVVPYAKVAGDAFEELDGCGDRLVGDRYNFYPLGELVDCDQKKGVTSWRRFRQRPNLIESPLLERRGHRYCHQIHSWSVWFWGEALTWITLIDQVSSVLSGSWHVESCSESFGDKCSAPRVVTTSTFMYIPQQSFSIFECDAPLKYARYASFVKFASYHCICFGSAGDAPCLCWIFG